MPEVKTSTGSGGSLSITLPDTTSNPNGSKVAPVRDAQPKISFPPQFGSGKTGVSTSKNMASEIPQNRKKADGDHGGETSVDPGPKREGLPGMPPNLIPNG